MELESDSEDGMDGEFSSHVGLSGLPVSRWITSRRGHEPPQRQPQPRQAGSRGAAVPPSTETERLPQQPSSTPLGAPGHATWRLIHMMSRHNAAAAVAVAEGVADGSELFLSTSASSGGSSDAAAGRGAGQSWPAHAATVRSASAGSTSGPGPHRQPQHLPEAQLNLIACMCSLRGEALIATGNPARAKHWFLAALRCDAFAADALQALLDHHLLTDAEEGRLDTLLAHALSVPIWRLRTLPGLQLGSCGASVLDTSLDGSVAGGAGAVMGGDTDDDAAGATANGAAHGADAGQPQHEDVDRQRFLLHLFARGTCALHLEPLQLAPEAQGGRHPDGSENAPPEAMTDRAHSAGAAAAAKAAPQPRATVGRDRSASASTVGTLSTAASVPEAAGVARTTRAGAGAGAAGAGGSAAALTRPRAATAAAALASGGGGGVIKLKARPQRPGGTSLGVGPAPSTAPGAPPSGGAGAASIARGAAGAVGATPITAAGTAGAAGSGAPHATALPRGASFRTTRDRSHLSPPAGSAVGGAGGSGGAGTIAGEAPAAHLVGPGDIAPSSAAAGGGIPLRRVASARLARPGPAAAAAAASAAVGTATATATPHHPIASPPPHPHAAAAAPGAGRTPATVAASVAAPRVLRRVGTASGALRGGGAAVARPPAAHAGGSGRPPAVPAASGSDDGDVLPYDADGAGAGGGAGGAAGAHIGHVGLAHVGAGRDGSSPDPGGHGDPSHPEHHHQQRQQPLVQTDNAWLLALHRMRLRRYAVHLSVPARFDAVERAHGLGANYDVLSAKAEALAYQHDAAAAHAVSRKLVLVDAHCRRTALLHYSNLLALGRATDLFDLAHAAVRAAPRDPLSWFAVAAYYMCLRRYDAAAKHYQKATQLDATHAPSWIGIGHAYEALGEHEPALGAYRAAMALLPGCHVPPMSMATVALRTGQPAQARLFLDVALSLCQSDPLLFHEEGVLAYKLGEYEAALTHFQRVTSLTADCPQHLRRIWEPTLFNKGHALRKLGRYEEAIGAYESALAVQPNAAATVAALAFTHHMAGDFDKAIACYHTVSAAAGVLEDMGGSGDARGASCERWLRP